MTQLDLPVDRSKKCFCVETGRSLRCRRGRVRALRWSRNGNGGGGGRGSGSGGGDSTGCNVVHARHALSAGEGRIVYVVGTAAERSRIDMLPNPQERRETSDIRIPYAKEMTAETDICEASVVLAARDTGGSQHPEVFRAVDERQQRATTRPPAVSLFVFIVLADGAAARAARLRFRETRRSRAPTSPVRR